MYVVVVIVDLIHLPKCVPVSISFIILSYIFFVSLNVLQFLLTDRTDVILSGYVYFLIAKINLDLC